MALPFLKKETFSRRLLLIIGGISLLPLIICPAFLLKITGRFDLLRDVSIISFLVTFALLIVLLAILGSLHFSRQISEPLKQFTRSATEIARGNFTHKIPLDSDDELGKLAKIFNFMTTELRRLNDMNLNKIITEKSKTETIIKNIADGVIVTDPENKVLIANAVAESWFGLREADLINQPLEKLVYEQKLLSLINKTIVGGNHEDDKVEFMIKPDNKRKSIVVQAKAARVIDTEDKLIGIVTILRDITREKEIDRLKTELVSMVAHELRSPLTSIAGFSELLLDTDVTEQQSKEYAEIILKESNRLGDLINKFLDISRIESGKSQMHRTPIHLGQVIENVLQMNMYLAERKGMQLHLNIPSELSLIWADREMLGEVILNLFSNAVKYSPEGKNIYIDVRDEAAEQVISVRDEGYGIPEKSLGKIFEKFYRVPDNEQYQEVRGSGLGLALVKEIVELHDGTIWVESQVGKGSNFTFSIPKTNGELAAAYELPESELDDEAELESVESPA
ncbi:MAG: ATP-binding protein [candidate division KSB1 bacterium]|nr:ATP-binding protein [candidate division KSB1 bacterium]MDZ7319834.1 ATP-binding protein [candidate division KSB1 bacterium]MDZ7341305.1 ATP-binding protein [candidate division KSB1 bacterium]